MVCGWARLKMMMMMMVMMMMMMMSNWLIAVAGILPLHFKVYVYILVIMANLRKKEEKKKTLLRAHHLSKGLAGSFYGTELTLSSLERI